MEQPESLPDGWVKVTHSCGEPFYLESSSGVVSWTIPYIIPVDDTVRSHIVPLYANSKALGADSVKPSTLNPISVLQVHTQKNHGVPPTYSYQYSEKPDAPFECIITIEGTEYGRACAASKKTSRLWAAEAALKKITPGTSSSVRRCAESATPSPVVAAASSIARSSVSKTDPKMTTGEFKTLLANDKRVYTMCQDCGYKTPTSVLGEYQSRNRGINVVFTELPKDNNSEFKVRVSVGSLVAEGAALSKRLAKQYASQNLLTKIFPKFEFYYQIATHFAAVGKNEKRIAQSPVCMEPKAKRHKGEKERASIGQWTGFFGNSDIPDSIDREGDFHENKGSVLSRLKDELKRKQQQQIA